MSLTNVHICHYNTAKYRSISQCAKFIILCSSDLDLDPYQLQFSNPIKVEDVQDSIFCSSDLDPYQLQNPTKV
jgi:hypothetical protein